MEGDIHLATICENTAGYPIRIPVHCPKGERICKGAGVSPIDQSTLGTLSRRRVYASSPPTGRARPPRARRPACQVSNTPGQRTCEGSGKQCQNVAREAGLCQDWRSYLRELRQRQQQQESRSEASCSGNGGGYCLLLHRLSVVRPVSRGNFCKGRTLLLSSPQLGA
jgi:hypothetical protein